MENKLFRQMLSLSRQIGGEVVANMESIPSIKMDFESVFHSHIKNELKERGVNPETLTENEKSAFIFSYIQGWNAEVFNRMGI